MKRIAQQVMDAEVIVPIPHVLAVILACAAGAAQVLNQTTINVSASWHAYIALGLAVVAYMGIKPLVGDQFREALHLPAWVAQAVTALVAAATVVVGVLPAGGPYRPALTAAVTVLIALGFGPAASSIAPAAARRRASRRHRAALDLEQPKASPAKR